MTHRQGPTPLPLLPEELQTLLPLAPSLLVTGSRLWARPLPATPMPLLITLGVSTHNGVHILLASTPFYPPRHPQARGLCTFSSLRSPLWFGTSVDSISQKSSALLNSMSFAMPWSRLKLLEEFRLVSLLLSNSTLLTSTIGRASRLSPPLACWASARPQGLQA